MTGEAIVAGVGLHPFGRFDDKSYREIGETAARAALEDAGVSFKDVEAVFVGNVQAEMAKAANIAERIGLTGVPLVALENACASGGSALNFAARLVVAGAYDVVLALGVEKAARGFIPDCGYESWQIESGLGVNPAYFALAAAMRMSADGVTERQLARVSVKNHEHGVHNPNAMYRKRVSEEEVLGSRMVCDPLRLLMLCAPNEGAAAAVLMTPEAARRHGVTVPVLVRAAAIASRLPGQLFVPAASAAPADRVATSTGRAAASAYEEAGIGPGDVDVFEVQDTDSASELIAYEELGICDSGEAGELLDSGATEIGGERPVNPSGGLLSKGEPLGASAIGQVAELVTQLRGEAGARQVQGASVGLSHTIGAGGNCSVIILSR